MKGVPIVVEDCYVSFDGDADRIVFFYIDKSNFIVILVSKSFIVLDGEFVLLDGDKIACLVKP